MQNATNAPISNIEAFNLSIYINFNYERTIRTSYFDSRTIRSATEPIIIFSIAL